MKSFTNESNTVTIHIYTLEPGTGDAYDMLGSGIITLPKTADGEITIEHVSQCRQFTIPFKAPTGN